MATEAAPLLDDDDGALSPARGAVTNRVSPDGGDYDEELARSNTKARRRVALVILALAVALIGAAIAVGVLLAGNTSSDTLQNAVRTPNIFAHLDRLNVIAANNGLNSRSVRDNYNASADYVIQQLQAAGVCTPVTQHFVVPVHEQLATPELVQVAPQTLPYLEGVDFIGMRYGGNGTYTDVEATLFVAPNGGCAAADYAAIEEGQIAAADEGGCDVVIKALAAQEAGAIALLQLNLQTSTSLRNTRVRFVDWKEGDALVLIPTFSVSWSVGSSLKHSAAVGNVTLRYSFSAQLTLDYTYNIICDTASDQKASNIVMIGAHLDSVPEGPGLDDNASGSSTVLELALQYHRLGFSSSAVNPARFAWWGAEEIGLLGARHYVRTLQASGTLGQIALYLNYDMLGAPNYTPQIHKGDAVNDNIPEAVQKSSTVIQQTFEQYFGDEQLPFDYASMTGGSDYLPFLEAGVPSGGMATGASALKSEEERTKFGGFANAAYDPCYHQPCDTVFNVSPEGLRQCSEAAAFVLQSFVFDRDLKQRLSPAQTEL